jgi:omega-6 fatty acid desaturase (delta-12 desaturase)
MFAPHQFGQIIISDIGILLWLGTLVAWVHQSGFSQVFRLYLVPYLW